MRCVESSKRTFLEVLHVEFRQFISADVAVEGLLKTSDFFLGTLQ